MRKYLSICILCTVLAACLHHRPTSTIQSVCAAPPERPQDDQLLTLANEVLKSSDWSEFRTEYNVRGADREAQWVTDDRVCDKLAAALARAGSSSARTTLPVAAVRAGNIYLVRFHPDEGGWVFDAAFRILTTFVTED